MNSGGSSSSSSSSSTPNFDNLLLQSLMSRLQLHPNLHVPPPPPPFSSGATKSLEDLLFSDLLLNLSDDSDSDNDNDNNSSSTKTPLAREESKLEKEIVRTILSGDFEDKLKPNSGQAITIGEHHICVGFQDEPGSDYRVWEWHGHIMLFDEENGYSPEYIYGNYFERRGKKTKKDTGVAKKEMGDEKVGLKELTMVENGGESGGNGRILHRNLNANSGSPRFQA